MDETAEPKRETPLEAFQRDYRDALIGTGFQLGRRDVDAYDYDKCIEIIMEDDYTREEAEDCIDIDFSNDFSGDSSAPILVRMKRIPDEPPLP